MPFHQDFNFVLEGNVVAFRKGSRARAASLLPGKRLTLSFSALEGQVAVSVIALDLRTPTRIRVVGPLKDPHDPEGPRTNIEEFNHVPVTIDLIPPGQNAPVVTKKTTDEGFSETESFDFTHVVGGPTSKPGIWQCRVANRGKVAAEVFIGVSAIFDREALQAAELPLQLIDHAYQVILEALTPKARLDGSTATISFGAELVEFFGNASGLLGPHHKDISPLEGEGSLQSVDLRATSGKEVLDKMVGRWQSTKTALEAALDRELRLVAGGQGSFLVVQSLEASLKANDEFRSDFEKKVKPDFAAIHAQATFSTISLEVHLGLIITDIEIPIVEIEDATVDVYLAFDRSLQHVHPLILTPAEITGGLLDLVDRLGFLPSINKILDSVLSEPIQKASPLICRYLGEALARLSARDAVFMLLTANDFTWRVQYTPIPKEQTFVQGSAGGTLATTVGDKVGASSVGGAATSAVGGGGTQPEPTGEIPPEFIVRAPETLERLDEIKTIVVVMMENRSFDHMLGSLRTARGPKYEGLVGNESNPADERGEVQVVEASKVIFPLATRIPSPGPDHGSASVLAQIDGGKMSGFAAEYQKRNRDFPDTVMTYYTDEELTTYYDLAASYKICDHWFAAHPGPTWPNRWCAFGGTAFDLNNLDRDDPNIGFIEGLTIFELLDKRGIDWRIFESDLSLIRTYNRYRLNAQRVVPFDNRRDSDQSFVAVAARGELPPVVFVEPNFSDIPPLTTANDDLVPVNLVRGQKFVKDIYEALLNKPQWNDTLLLITYDEHGGFYDHVPPPGTPLGPPEFFDAEKEKGLVPRIHPKGADHLGVRVPAILVSPRVDAGEVSKEVFDHTSIIKTILLRHRAKFFKDDFTRFGLRVNQANHLGLALDLLRSSDDKPKPLRSISLKKAQPERIGATPFAAGKPELDDFHEALRRGFLPRRGSS